MNPRLSIVATSRNDNHGGDLLKRMQIFIDGIITQSKQFDFEVELILVEWNPPPDKPSLYEALDWPDDLGTCQIRIIEVPAELHNQYKYSEGLPLFQFIAKNVGIVRARGEYVLSTNVDIIFSEKLFNLLQLGDFKQGKYYRVDRYDVAEKLYNYKTFPEILAACDENVVRKCYREGFTECSSGEFIPLYAGLPFFGKRLHLIPFHEYLVKKKLFRIPYYFSGLYRDWLRLHTNASGDFMMMSKKDWFRIRGAPEIEVYAINIDALVCYIAHYAGIEECVLEPPIYHIEHKTGWTPASGEDGSYYKRLEGMGVRVMTIEELDKCILEMQVKKAPLIDNDENWGLRQENLKETIV